jgi:UDP-hydrolysing UDP-N-acetyl-D-glucosamine 2-epimerase
MVLGQKKVIGIFTGTRADYNLLYWIMEKVTKDPDLRQVLFVTGTHLANEYGATIAQIREDGFAIDAEIRCISASNSSVGVAESFGTVVKEMASQLDRLKPDYLVLLGDRYEALAAASAALLTKTPIAHLHGGELTEGAIDDQMRHAITKLSTWHFVAAEEYRNRVIQLGEDPSRVWTVGALGIESILATPTLDRREFESRTGFSFQKNNILLTIHPETVRDRSGEVLIDILANSLKLFSDLGVLITAANSDEGGQIINEKLQIFVAKNSNAKFIPNLGRLLYVNALRFMDAVVGNSSSGILEAPSVPVPTINIGDRQHGRLRSPSVIDCSWSSDEIVAALLQCLDSSWRKTLSARDAVFGDGTASSEIVRILKSLPTKVDSRKPFFDLKG